MSNFEHRADHVRTAWLEAFAETKALREFAGRNMEQRRAIQLDLEHSSAEAREALVVIRDRLSKLSQ